MNVKDYVLKVVYQYNGQERYLIDENDDILAYDIVYTQLTGSENFKSYALDSDFNYLNLTQNKVLTAFSDRQYVNISNSDQIEKLFYAEEDFYFPVPDKDSV